MTKGVSRKDVARLAGVSTATVSYVINNGPRPVSPETRARVLEIIQRLGYQPSSVARNLRRQRTSTLGVILPDTLNPYFGQVVRGIERVAFEHGYIVIQLHSDYSLQRELQFADLLYAERVAGAIWIPTTGSAEPVERLVQHRIPVVVLDRQLPDIEIPTVVADNFRGGYLATSHLIALGHTRIGYIGRQTDLSHSQQRLEGYRAALQEHGLAFDPTLIARGGFRMEDGRAAACELLQRTPRPTAIFAYNDFNAIGALRAAYECGLRVPDDLAIVGFDDIPGAAFTLPALTTIRQPKLEMGQRAAELLLDLIAGQGAASSPPPLEVELIVRESSGASKIPYPFSLDLKVSV